VRSVREARPSFDEVFGVLVTRHLESPRNGDPTAVRAPRSAA